MGCAVGRAEPFEVHRQECDVEQDVATSETFVERQAIEDPGTVLEHEDVVGE